MEEKYNFRDDAMKRFLFAGAAALSFTLVSGCATVVRGSSEGITFQSTPSGALVKLSSGQSCMTPCELEVKRKGEIFVTVEKDGYKTLETALVSSIDGGSLALGTTANIIFLPIINDVVDYNTGANYSRKPNPLIVTLIETGSNDDYQQVDPAAVAEAGSDDAAAAEASSE